MRPARADFDHARVFAHTLIAAMRDKQVKRTARVLLYLLDRESLLSDVVESQCDDHPNGADRSWCSVCRAHVRATQALEQFDLAHERQTDGQNNPR